MRFRSARHLVHLGLGLAAIALAIPAARAGSLKSPEFGDARKAFRSALRPPRDEAGPTIEDRKAVIGKFVGVLDEGVFKELFKAIGPVSKQAAAAEKELIDITAKLNQAQGAYFDWVEDEYRRTGKIPEYGMKVHIDATETWRKKQQEAAAVYDLWISLREALAGGLRTHLTILGTNREHVWKEAVQLGTSSRDPLERAAFCDALGALEGPEVHEVLGKMDGAEGEPEVLVALVRAMGERRSPELLDRLVKRLGHEDWRVAVAAAAGLARLRDPRVLPALIGRLKTAEGRLFEDLVETLFEATGKHLPDSYEAWNGWWTEHGEAFMARWGDDVRERLDIIEKISATDPRQIDIAAELAALLATEPDNEVRQEIVVNLSLQRSQVARHRLVRALRDAQRDVRLAVIRGLAHYRHLSVPAELMRLVPEADAEEIGEIFRTLRALWGGDDEFSVGAPSRDGLLRWWDTNKGRVGNQFIKLGAIGIAAGHKESGGLDGLWRDRNFYGLRIYSTRVLFVVDISLSMEEPANEEGGDRKKIDVAKAELSRAIKALPEDARFGMMTFSGTFEIWERGLVDATSVARKRGLAWVEKLETRAATNVFDALEAAFQLGMPGSPHRSAAGAPDTIYLVSDGQPTVGKFTANEDIQRYVRMWNETRGIKIHCIGVGPEQDVEFLRELAEKNGGHYVLR